MANSDIYELFFDTAHESRSLLANIIRICPEGCWLLEDVVFLANFKDDSLNKNITNLVDQLERITGDYDSPYLISNEQLLFICLNDAIDFDWSSLYYFCNKGIDVLKNEIHLGFPDCDFVVQTIDGSVQWLIQSGANVCLGNIDYQKHVKRVHKKRPEWFFEPKFKVKL